MPRIITPDGLVKYYETEDELEQERVEAPQVVQEPAVEAPKPAAEAPQPQPTPQAQPQPTEEEEPSWWKETLKTLGFIGVQVPNELAVQFQETAQATPASMLAGMAGGDPTAYLLGQSLATGKGFKQVAKEDVEQAEKGRRAAQLGISLPDEQGNTYKLALPKETPLIGELSEEGNVYKAFEPDTEIGKTIADVGSAILMSGLLPNFTLVSPVGKVKSLNMLRNVAAGRGSLRAAFFAEPLKFTQRSLGSALALARNVAIDLPQDFIEELVLFGAPEPTEEELKDRETLLNTNDPQLRQAIAARMLTDDDAEAAYYDRYFANVFQNTQLAGVFRGTLGAFNKAFRIHKAKGRLKAKDVLEATSKDLENTAVHFERDAFEVLRRAEMEELGEINTNFTSLYRDSIEALSDRARGIQDVELALIEPRAQIEGFGGAAEAALGAQTKVQQQVEFLNNQITARSESIKEMDKMEAAKPGYLKGKNKARYNRYLRQIENYQSQLEAATEEFKQKSTFTSSLQDRVSLASAQQSSLQANQQQSVEGFISEMDPLMTRLKEMTERRRELAPEMDLSEDPYFQSYERLRVPYENYKLFGGAAEYPGAPGLEEKRLANQADLLNAIQDEYQGLQEFGGAAPIQIKEEVVEAAARQARGEQPDVTVPKEEPKAPEAAEAAPKAEEPAPEAAPKPEEVEQKRLWEDPTITPLTTNANGQIVPDPAANRKTGVTAEVPQTKDARMRRAQINLGLRDADAAEQITEEVRRATTDDAVKGYLTELNEIEALQERMAGKGVVPYERNSSAIKALERSVGKYETYEARKMALIDSLRRMAQGEPEEFIAPVLKRGFKMAGQLANAMDSFDSLYEMLNTRMKARGKAIKGLKEAMFEYVATPMIINAHGNRLYRTVESLYEQMDQLTAGEKATYRAVAAQEALMLYQSLGDWMKLRRLSSNLLSIQQGKYQRQVAAAYTEARIRVKSKKDPEKVIEQYVKDVESFQAELAQDAIDKLPSYIGLPSNLKNVEAALNKFTDPNLEPSDDDLAIFNKIISQLTVAGLNAQTLGSLSITGDQILGRQMLAGGLSGISSQTSYPVQTMVYGATNWVNKLVSGKINQMWNVIPWLADKEALQAAQTEARIAALMPRMMAQVSGDVLHWFYKGRQFNRSIITDAAHPLEDTSKFAGPRFKDPIREAEQLKILNNPNGISEDSILNHLKKYIPEERLAKYRNNFFLDMVNLHDQFFLGDAYEQMGTSGMGKLAKGAYNLSPQGLFDRALRPLTRGKVTPFESKLPSGERVGGSLPLVASETGTELIGGLFANAFAKAKAQIQVEGMLDEAGRPRYAVGTKEFNDAVEKAYRDEYLAPITVGVGEKAQTIAYSVKDRDAQLLAMSLDMMMPLEDDVWGGLTEAAKKLGESDYTLFKAAIAPYVRTPLNAHKFHFYYSQPIPFLDSTGIGVPMGAAMESAVAIRRLIQKKQGAKELSDSFAKFQSKIFHKDARVRAEARSGLAMSTLLNTAVFGLVESNAIEVTGGQNTSYREAMDASIPAYSIKLGGQWLPYRFLPFVGELLAYHANLRDYKRRAARGGDKHFLGAAIVATAQTFLDTPAIAGLDTMISALRDPAKAEQFILDYFERIGGVRYPPLRQAILRAGVEAYGARPVVSGARAGVLDVKQPGKQDLTKAEAEPFTFGEGMSDLAQSINLELPIRFFIEKANSVGLLPVIEAIDEMKGDEVMPGDYRQAHWYKPGDITYNNPSERATMQTILGRYWPVPADSDPVDVELFRNGIQPPTQVFRKYGIVANEVMVNRFRRFLGTEYRGVDGKPLEEIFRDTVENKTPIPGLVDVYYKDLPEDERNALVLDPGPLEVIDTENVVTKRAALMQIRSDHIQRAVVQFLTGEKEMIEGANVVKKPIEISAPEDAKRAFQEYKLSKTAL